MDTSVSAKAELTRWEAACWLARMAATDGFVSPSERGILKEFALHFGLDPARLYRMAHAIAGRQELPEVEPVDPPHLKGRLFEEFVVSLFSDKSRFRLLAWRGDKTAGNIYAIENMMPDLHLRHRLRTHEVEYFIECKYRSALPDGILDLGSQLERYRHFAAERQTAALFIAIGIGGSASAPDSFYLIPDTKITRGTAIRLDELGDCLCPTDPDAFHTHLLRHLP